MAWTCCLTVPSAILSSRAIAKFVSPLRRKRCRLGRMLVQTFRAMNVRLFECVGRNRGGQSVDALVNDDKYFADLPSWSIRFMVLQDFRDWEIIVRTSYLLRVFYERSRTT